MWLGYVHARKVPLVLFGVKGCPDTPSRLFLGLEGHPDASMSCSRGHGALGTPTDFLPGLVGGPYTFPSWSWG